jgi:hypothetical protein
VNKTTWVTDNPGKETRHMEPTRTPMTKEEFKVWARFFMPYGNVTWHRYDEHGTAMTIDEFCALLHPHDAKLASLVRNFHEAAEAMGNHVRERLGEAAVLPRPR